MRKVQLYIGPDKTRIDLFDDEEISVSSSIKNIDDVSKVFTDFTQTFTVPGSKANNATFKHYYNTDVNGGFAANTRAEGIIELNLDLFRVGRIQLESCEVVNNRVESYKITFYGETTSLKDLFGNDKLKDLDYAPIDFNPSADNIRDRIILDTDFDVRYPLITSDRPWEYGTATANDISIPAGAVKFNDLFPAVKVSKLFEFIKTKYGLTFQGTFLTTDRFLRQFMWWKNRKSSIFPTAPAPLIFGVGDPSTDIIRDSTVNVVYRDVAILAAQVAPENLGGVQTHTVIFFRTGAGAFSSFTLYVDVFVNGVFTNTIQAVIGQNVVAVHDNVVGLNKVYTFQVRTLEVFPVTSFIQYEFDIPTFPNLTPLEIETNACDVVNVQLGFDFVSTAPDQKVVDFFSGVLKEFHLVCYPLSANVFQIEPLENWYLKGDTIDITQFVDIKSIVYERVRLYDSISFEWEPSKSQTNRDFFDTFDREYGDLKETFGFDGGDFSIKLPFENFRFRKFDTTNIQVGYSLDQENKHFTPKPVMLYLHDLETADVSFRFEDELAATELLTQYVPMGQDLEENTQNFSLNWGNEVSTLLEQPIPNSLYTTYYENYFINLYNDKTRFVALIANLPLPILSKLELNDKLIVREKLYRINDMKTNLSTGEVKFKLINDFISFVCPQSPPLFLRDTIETAVTQILLLNNHTALVSIEDVSPFITTVPVLPATFLVDTSLSISAPANTTGLPRTNTIKIEHLDANGDVSCTDFLVITQNPQTDRLITQDGFGFLTQDFNILITQ